MMKFILQNFIVPIDNRIEVAIHYEKRSPKLIVQNALGSGGHLAVSSKEIFSIVGRDWGLGCKCNFHHADNALCCSFFRKRDAVV